MIVKRKSYIIKNPETKFRMNKDFSCRLKNLVYVVEYNKCKEICIGSTQALNTRISIYKSNIKITENRKINVSIHLYECRHGKFKLMCIYQTIDYTLLQIKDLKTS